MQQKTDSREYHRVAVKAQRSVPDRKTCINLPKEDRHDNVVYSLSIDGLIWGINQKDIGEKWGGNRK